MAAISGEFDQTAFLEGHSLESRLLFACARVAFGRALPRRVAHVRAVDLAQQPQAAAGDERGGHALPALVTRLAASLPVALLEPVDEAGHLHELGDSDVSQQPLHALPCYPAGRC